MVGEESRASITSRRGGKGAASWVRFRWRLSGPCAQVRGTLGPRHGACSVVLILFPTHRRWDGSPRAVAGCAGLIPGHGRSACCVLQPKKNIKSCCPHQHSIHNVWVTLRRNEPLPLTPALEQGLRDLLRKKLLHGQKALTSPQGY